MFIELIFFYQIYCNVIPGLDPTKMSLSQADVLSTIETAKAEGMTAEEEAGIVQIAKDAQVSVCPCV